MNLDFIYTDLRFIVFLALFTVLFLAIIRLDKQSEKPNKALKRFGAVSLTLTWIVTILTGIL